MIQVVKHLPLYAATERIATEWDGQPLFTVLRLQALYTNWLCWKHTGLLTLITNIKRTEAEQRIICKGAGIDYYLSVHQLWRGLDQVPVDGNGSQVFIALDIGKAIEARVRLAFPYSGSPGIGSCLWHNVVGPSPGKGDHWHQQAGWREPNYRVDLKAVS
jgi:hypothetical protein